MPERLIARLPKTLTKGVLTTGVFAGAGTLAALAAWASAIVIEDRSVQAVNSRLLDAGITWAETAPNGLQVILRGTAPDEAARFRAVNLAGSVIDASRVRDQLDVTPVKAIEPPRFSLEILRNDDGIQLIGLLPAGSDVEALRSDAGALDADNAISDMVEVAEHPAPEGWQNAFAFGFEAVKRLPRSKVSIAADKVHVTAIADSAAEQRRLEAELAALRPEGLSTLIEISAPRPVLTPFTLRFVVEDGSARFDACSADTEQSRNRILKAGSDAGATGRVNCTIGLGVPSPSWAEAAALAIAATKTLGAASVTFSDADVSLNAASSVDQRLFDRVVGELETDLPDVFSLTATLEKKADSIAGPAEFLANLAEDGRVELRGRVTDELARATAESFAKARFGTGKVYVATRYDETLPDGWPIRVLVGLEALAELVEGKLTVTADSMTVEGVTGSLTARDRVSQILSAKLGQGQTFRINIRYDEELDPLAALPTPEECNADVQSVLQRQKIIFPPGSAEIDGTTAQIMDALAQVFEDCPGLRMEIGGHTDSQGSEGGNQALSQARAEAVLVALQGRGVDVSGLTAKGYGEALPIAENDTDTGREANRRIEFTLIVPVAAAPSPAADVSQAAEPAPQPQAPATAAPETATPVTPAQPEATETPPSGDEAPEAVDDSPSVAPTEKTRRPLARPSRDG